MNYIESSLKRQNRLVPRWAGSRNDKFPITNFNKLPKGYKSKNFVIKDERELIKLCYAYGLLDNETKVTISDSKKLLLSKLVVEQNMKKK